MLPLKLRPAAILLLRLTSISPSTTVLLISCHACTQLNVDSRWGYETEALRHFHEIELIDVEDTTEAVRCIGLQVRPVAILR